MPLVRIGGIGRTGGWYSKTVGLRQGYLFIAEQAGGGGENFLCVTSGYCLQVVVDTELGGAVQQPIPPCGFFGFQFVVRVLRCRDAASVRADGIG